MDKTEKEIQRGRRAENILNDDVFKEACEHVESEVFRLFKEISPADTEGLKHIKAMQYFHGKYQAFLKSAITNGKIAQINLDAKKGIGQRIKDVIHAR